VKFPALGAFFVVMALVMAACGGGSSSDVPGDSVAKVGDTDITKAQFQHWYDIAAKGSAQATPGQPVVVPDPPDFTKCVADKKAHQPKASKSQPKQSDDQLKEQCKQSYETLRDQTMNFLIQADWVTGEAKDQNITVTDADVQKQFQQTKKQAFPKEADFQKFLKQSGMSMDDILFRVRLDALSNKLRQKIVSSKSDATDAQVKAYYNAHKSQFSTPEQRDIALVLTKDKAKAEAAKKALQSGQSFKTVAKKYSIDQQTKNNGGVLKGVSKGDQDAALDKAAFAAPKGKLEGPIKSPFGYYVFEVQKITPASQQSLAKVTPTIKQQLVAQNQQKALTSFVADFRKRWTAKTECRQGYVVEGCKGAPKPKTDTTAAPTAPTPTTPTAPTTSSPSGTTSTQGGG
jgi:foldase protein PrsA